ncbi:uncharacterized protein LOC108101067 [Drosophila ficusphila]|uniref:uncharacterized protein LOC108101067 n=1 Tax=Drosophila ficusphila TaxID=30025 RepID=UPI0007E719B2|nr:uncharacterized protein LOC108101067 [Drosophila ficusphila]
MSARKRLRASTQEWCDRNSKPKSPRLTPRVRPEPTRWQKPGPMDRNDWANFHSRYQIEAAAAVENVLRMEGGIQKKCGKVCKEKKTSEDIESLKENEQRLSMPRWQRKKYIPPPPEEYPYRPRITGKPVQCPERGRPVKRTAVPHCFQHIELEIEFWANLRFPVSQNALRASPKKKILELSRPRKCPPKPHCPGPNNSEDQMPRRRKMSPRQWRLHLQRLEFLSRPNQRVLAELLCCCT